MTCIAGALLLLPVIVPADGDIDFGRRALKPTVGETGPAGTLRTVGAYPRDLKGFRVTPLAEGKVFVYGADPVNTRIEGTTIEQVLRNRGQMALSGAYFNEPLLWNPGQHGWQRLPLPPECQYYRVLHTATALPGGKVLIAGGLCDAPRMADDRTPMPQYTRLSLWDGATGKWEAAPSLTNGRIFHSASVLKDGSVMIVGGERDPIVSSPGETVLNSVEAYRDGTVAQLAPLGVARLRHTATLLADGSLLVAGGLDRDGKPTASVERWDPARQAWHQQAPLSIARYNHSATLLRDGRVMIAGGISQDGEPVGGTEIWDPSRQAWSGGAPLLLPLQAHSAALLTNGDVLVMGGFTVNKAPVSMAMLWDQSVEEWRPAGFIMPNVMHDKESYSFTLVPRADGSAHVFGYRWIAQWLPEKKTAAAPLYGARESHTSTMLHDGRILLAGGRNGNAFADWAEIYNPATGRFSATTRMHQARHSHSALVLDDGRVLVAGGWTRQPDSPRVPTAHSPEVWDPVSGRWGLISSIRFEWQDWVTLGRQSDGRILFFASRELSEDMSSPQGPVESRAWLWNPATGRVDTLRPSATPHSRAAIVVHPDGRVLRFGGYTRRFVPEYRCPASKKARSKDSDGGRCEDVAAHWEEDFDDFPEAWNSRTGAVTQLDAMPDVRIDHLKPLLLRNGDVLMMGYTPPSPWSNSQPAPVLQWNASTGKWRTLPSLPVDSSWPVTELRDGTLVTNTRWLHPGAQAWTPAPAYPQYAWPNASSITSSIFQPGAGPLLALSTHRPHVALLDEKSAEWKVVSNSYLLRGDGRRTALLPLADGRLLVSGMVQGRTGQSPTVQIWNPKDDSWTVTSKLTGVYGGAVQLAQLPSGRVVHAGMDSKNNIVCEVWQPTDDIWKVCGYISSKDKPIREFYLGTLGDGRVALLIGNAQVHVYNEQTNDWVPMQLEWSKSPMVYGAPIRVDGPLARALDPVTRVWVDASSIGSRYVADHTSSMKSISLLWDSAKQEFSYFFAPVNDGMGRDVVVLPDGCALSAMPLSLFSPATGKVTSLVEPVIGIPGHARSHALLPGGIVVIAGYPEGAAGDGAGFFHRKASCAGFEVLPGDDAFIPGVIAGQAAAAPPSKPAAPPAASFSLHDFILEYRLPAQVVLSVMLLYMFIRYVLMPLIQRSRIIDFGRKSSMKAAVIKRIVGYSIAAVFIVPMLLSHIQMRQINTGDECASNTAACLDRDTGLLKSIPSLAGGWFTRARPEIPCRFVGVWSSRQADSPMYRITLGDDGRYSAEQSRDGAQVYVIDTGYWMVQNNNMVWRSERHSRVEADINPILPESATRFQLVEGNGKHTQFELISAARSSRCTP